MRPSICAILVVLALLIVPVSAYANSSLERSGGRSESVANRTPISPGLETSAKNFAMANWGNGQRFVDPNILKLTAPEILTLQAALKSLRDAKRAGKRDAWSSLSAAERAVLAKVKWNNDAGITVSNWEQEILGVVLLPKRTWTAKAVDPTRASGETFYDTRTVAYQQAYTDWEPLYASYNGCGCRGRYVYGWNPVTRHRTEYRNETYAVAKLTAVVGVQGVQEPFSSTKQVPYQVQVAYTDWQPIYVSYNGCGCHGTYLAGWSAVTRYTSETRYRTESFTAFSNRLPNAPAGYVPSGNGDGSTRDDRTEERAGFVRQSTNDGGTVNESNLDARNKGNQLGSTRAENTDDTGGAALAQDASRGTKR